jgi:hypothetical protein
VRCSGQWSLRLGDGEAYLDGRDRSYRDLCGNGGKPLHLPVDPLESVGTVPRKDYDMMRVISSNMSTHRKEIGP